MASFTNNVKVTNFQIKSTEPVYSNQTLTGQRIVRSTGIQYYNIQFTLNFNPTAFTEVNSFLAQHAQGKPFTFSLGVIGTYRGTQTGSVTVSAITQPGNMVIPTSTNTLAVGEMIQFTNHKKLYRIVERTGTSITIFPALQNTVQASEVISYNNLIIEAVLDPDNDFTMPVGNIMNITLKATENIQ
ncbi:hypothetical protein [Enterobacter ludwigii]|uniref:Uncharacterized protein n=1 Tax=Enterobacter ludwigii TaxID=299767 RepID=A0AAX3LF58_9ENTR|nr:hypothetical protein [Enterobacter ludwigii]WCE14736.1 hypothetical protein PHA72_07685 [Enterobacter ludwigii]